MKKILLALPLFVLVGCSGPRVAHRYATATLPTPVLYTSDFTSVFGGADGKTLKFDDYGEIDELEMVALPGTVFTIEQDIPRGDHFIYKVSTDDYPYPTEKGYYIDSRFVQTMDEKPSARPRSLPSRADVMKRLLSADGSIYTWGGNWNAGIPQLLTFYTPSAAIDQSLKNQWMLKGVDCSGLLYEATGGYTPRNTSSLVTYGDGIEIAGLNAQQIAAKLQPLDVIVWNGHMIIVLDGGKTIESRLDYDDQTDGQQGGVRVRTVQEVLDQTLKVRTPVNNYDDPLPEGQKKFVVRRWYGKA